jgi:hypothetical protein
LFKLENETVPLEKDNAPARTAKGVSGRVEIDAVMTEPLTAFSPKVTLFALLKRMVPFVVAVRVPAAMMFTPSAPPPPDAPESTIEPAL